MGKLPGASDELKGLRVMIVDDEDDARDFLTVVLSQFGANVLAVNSAAAALREYESFNPAVVISDIGMPRQDGYYLIREIRARDGKSGRRVPAVALTAFARTEDRNKALAEGFQEHLSKPIEPMELVNTVARIARLN
jgi:CheY-like chemotaxis protein